jgi:hypothetical protein
MDPADVSPTDLAAAAQFLRQMLGSVRSKEASFKFFRAHLTELQNEALVAAVPLVFRELTAPDTNRSDEGVARDFVILGICLNEFPLANRALNLELSIAAYEAALQIYTRGAAPVDWAGIQNNLGLAYGIAFGGSGPTIWSRPSPPMNLPYRSTPAMPFPKLGP